MPVLIDGLGNSYEYREIEKYAECVCLDGNRMIQGRLEDFTIHGGPLPIVTPPQARLVFTSAERVFLKANIASDSPDFTLKDFFEELSDPQLTEVDFNLTSVRDAYRYALEFLAPNMVPPYNAEMIETRYEQILTGKPL